MKDLGLHTGIFFQFVKTIITTHSLSLREIETLVRHLEIYVTLNTNSLALNTIFIYKLLRLLGICLFCFQPKIATHLTEGKGDATEIGLFLNIRELPNTSTRGNYENLIMAVLGQESLLNSSPYIVNDTTRAEWQNTIETCFEGGGGWAPEVGGRKQITIEAINTLNFITA